jgi:hypothetical protein
LSTFQIFESAVPRTKPPQDISLPAVIQSLIPTDATVPCALGRLLAWIEPWTLALGRTIMPGVDANQS